MTAAATDAPRADDHSRWSFYLGIALRVVVCSAVIGLAVTLLDPNFDGLLINILYSECIGISIFSIYVGLRWRIADHREWSFRDHVVRGAIAIPIGFVIGINAGAFLTGQPTGFAVFSHVAPFSIVVTAFATIGFIYFFWSRNRLIEAAAAQSEARRTAAEAHLKLLRTQIEPHMLFNTLANLRSLVDVDPARAQTMIDELIVYLRATLAASRNPTATLAEEFAQLRAYLELMKVRMAHRLRYTLELPDALRDATIPPMLLQPLVENAIKHGLEPKIEGGSIRVVVTGHADRLDIEVSDDGVGPPAVAPTDGYGLANVRERLRALYDGAATMSASPAPGGGFVVRLSLPR